MNKKRGFISTIFLIILIIMSSIYLVLIYKFETEIKAIENIKLVNIRLNDEIKVVSFIKCKLLNDSLETKLYIVEDETYDIIIFDNTIECTYNNRTIIEFEFNNNEIIDYSIKS